MPPPNARVATFTRIEPWAKDTFLYTLSLDAPLDFKAGQFVNLAVPDAKPRGERSYSVWSDPQQNEALDLCIKLFEGGAASEYLRVRQVGDVASVRGPFGVFAMPPEGEVVFVATATGLAPFHSMLSVAARAGDQRHFRVYFGVRAEEDLFAVDILKELQGRLNLSVTLCLSRPERPWDGFKGRVSQAIFEDYAGNDAHYLLCGNAAMIDETKLALKERGVERKHIHFEKYY